MAYYRKEGQSEKYIVDERHSFRENKGNVYRTIKWTYTENFCFFT
jgi:hypothetical protein